MQHKSMRDIARDWSLTKRQRKSRTTEIEVEGVGKVSVLKSSDPPAPASRAKEGAAVGGRRNRLQIAGRDYNHMTLCQVRGRGRSCKKRAGSEKGQTGERGNQGAGGSGCRLRAGTTTI